jgi:predicted transcriptional regulator
LIGIDPICSTVEKMNSDSLHPFFKTTPSAQLGPLERQVLQAVWARGTATVREVREDGRVWQTYPTIMTTMDRLFKKGLLDRVPDGRAFRYSARYRPEELERVAAVNGIRKLLGSECASLHLSYLVEAVSTQDGKMLDELQALVERQRAQLKKGAPE